jgi:DNA-binding CsgD family transcriptional regulator
VLIDRGELAAAAATLELGEASALGAQRGLVLESRARLALVRGEPDAALADALGAGASLTEATVVSPSVVPWRGTAAIAALRVGDEARARRLGEEEIELARRIGAPRTLGMALRAAGLSRTEPGESLALLDEAVTVLESSPARLELARALIDRGAAQRRQGERVTARESLRRGLDLAHRFGAHALERQARDELAAAGARVRTPVASGPDSLTPSERRVAEMAAAGHANATIAQALFVTLRTVETHLTHAYRKLEIDARAELSAALARAD